MSRVVVDPFQRKVDESVFTSGATECKVFYGYNKENLPPGMSKPLGKISHTTCFVDDNHDGNVVTWHSHIGALIYVTNATIIWFSNNQKTVESSMFGSEFVAMNIVIYLTVALHYKLRMFDVPLDGPSDVVCDNQGGSYTPATWESAT